MKKIFKYTLLAAFLFFTACDSGDIYPDDDASSSGFEVDATFEIAGMEAFPKEYQLIFAAFNDGSSIPESYMRVNKPLMGNIVTPSLNNISRKTDVIKLCLATENKQVVYTFYQMPVAGSTTGDIVIPQQEINLIEYKRIQQAFFNRLCTHCHGTEADQPAAGLLLQDGMSYDNIVNVASSRSAGKTRIIPSDADSSFLLNILKDGSLLKRDHVKMLGGNLKQDDITLLQEWIKAGAVED